MTDILLNSTWVDLQKEIKTDEENSTNQIIEPAKEEPKIKKTKPKITKKSKNKTEKVKTKPKRKLLLKESEDVQNDITPIVKEEKLPKIIEKEPEESKYLREKLNKINIPEEDPYAIYRNDEVPMKNKRLFNFDQKIESGLYKNISYLLAGTVILSFIL